MATTRGIDEDDIVALLLGVSDGVAGDMRGVLAVPLLVQLHPAQPFALTEFPEVAGVHAELFDGARAEGVAGGDEDAQVVLQEEEGEFGQGSGFADAVDADDGDCVGTGGGEVGVCGVGDGVDGGEEGEGGCGGEDFAEGGFH